MNQSRWNDLVRAQLLEGSELKRTPANIRLVEISEAVASVAETLRVGGNVMLCDNVGSAADSQHLAAELVGRMQPRRERNPLSAVALTTDTSILTALGNDYGFDNILQRQVEALGRPGDILIVMSTSGNSANVLRAVSAA